MTDDVLIHFRLVGAEAKALRELAANEMRKPRDQTRLILRQELERRGLLTTTPAQDVGLWEGEAGQSRPGDDG